MSSPSGEGLSFFGDYRMWKLIKAELEHGKERILTFTLVYLVFIVITLTWVRWERNRIGSLLLFLFLMPLVAAYGGEKWRSEQKRDRFHGLLPISPIQIGLSHLALPVCLLVLMTCLYFVVIVLVQSLTVNVKSGPTGLQILAVTGLVLIVSAAGLLQRDLRVSATKKYQRFLIHLFWWMVYLSALLPFYIVMNFFGWFGVNTQLQQAIAGLGTRPHLLLLPGIGLSLLSLYVFSKRRSYVES
jgi:hypothetical protein